jgi:hypothetical protein
MKSSTIVIAALVLLTSATAGFPLVVVDSAGMPEVILPPYKSIEDEMATAEREMKAAKEQMETATGEQKRIAAKEELDSATKRMMRAYETWYKAMMRRANGPKIEKWEDAVQPVSCAVIVDHATGERTGPVGPLVLPPVVGTGYAGGVLVIPAEQIKTKQLATIMEDLSVMSRILDKKLGRSQDNPLFGNLSVFSDARAGTQCIYLDGYGALFIIKVDFPLAPSVRTPEQDETEEPADRLWEETRQEIFAGPSTISRRRIRVQQDREPRYDAEKVEELKSNLIKSLRHAANIRALEPEQWLIITVIGSGETNIVGILRDSSKGTVEVITKDGKIVRTTYEGGLPDNLGSCSPTVMTMRVKKSDVDAFAAGELDADAFREEVQIYTY